MATVFNTASVLRSQTIAYGFPLLGLGFFGLLHISQHPLLMIAAFSLLIACVLQAVYHAEVLAARVGQPLGSVLLAVAVTVIEVSIILSLMLSGGETAQNLARDTVFAAVMIIMTGMTGLILFTGARRFREQTFPTDGVLSLLTLLVTISVLTLILPDFTVAVPGPYYSDEQLLFVAITTLLLYAGFLYVQNFRHPDWFTGDAEQGHLPPGRRNTVRSLLLLPLNLLVVVLLAESMAPGLDAFIARTGAPAALSGIVIACIILLPEGISAYKAAAQNKMQKALNLTLGSALASISLTIPVVALISVFAGIPLALGIDTEAMVLFLLSLFVLILALMKGRTNNLHGLILLVLFAVYLFLTIVP